MLTRTFRGKRLFAGALVVAVSGTLTLMGQMQSDAVVGIGNHLVIKSVGTPPPPTPGAREFSVIAGQGVDVVVQVQDFLGSPAPLPYLEDKQISLTTSGPDAATFYYEKTLAAGQSTVTFNGVKWSTPHDGVVLTAQVVGGGATADTATGNVLETGVTVPAATPFWGYDGQTVSLTGCAATAENPVCVELQARSTTDQLLGFAPCTAAQGCLAGTDVATWLAGVNATVVTRANPNKLTVRIDKTLRGGRGVSQFQLQIQLRPDAAFVDVAPCPTATTVGPTQKFCKSFATSEGPAADVAIGINWIEDGRIVIK